MLSRSVLIGLLAAAATAVFAPAALATITPRLAIEQSAGTAAGSSVATGFDIKANTTVTDRLSSLTMGFPAGLLVNLNMNGGACVNSASPTPTCELGTGTINGPTGTPVALYLVASGKPADVAGVALVIQGGATINGVLTLTSSPTVALNLVFGEIPAASNVKELQFTLSSLRLPTSCSAVESVTLQASSWEGGSGSTSAPLSVSGCSSLPYAPSVAATVTKEGGSSGALIEVQFTQGAGEAATSALEFGEPPGVKLNKVLAPCFNGVTCTVGTVAATSPLLPSTALAAGMLTLAGSINPGNPSQAISGSLTMSFPAPFEFSVAGPIDLAEKMLTLTAVPDVPLSTLTFSFTGIPAGPAFTTECEAGTIAATMVSQNGNPPVKISGPVTNVNCPPPSAKPTASGSWSGLASGRPQLRLHAARGSNAPDISSLTLTLPGGVSFARRALGTHRSCRKVHGHQRCTTSPSVRGLSLSGAALAKARLEEGELVLQFAHAVPAVTLLAHGPLLSESKGLQRNAKRHKTGNLAAHIRITDTKGRATALSVA